MSICVLAALGSLSACAYAAAGSAPVPRAECKVDEPVDLGLLQMELHSNQSGDQDQEQTATEIINAYDCRSLVCHGRKRGGEFCSRASWCSTLDAVKEWCDSNDWCKGFWWRADGREVYHCESMQLSYGSLNGNDRLCMKGDPTPRPTTSPTAYPTSFPTTRPTPTPTGSPTAQPTPGPTPSPTPSPTSSPTVAPSASPTPSPTPGPTPSPTPSPTSSPTVAPSTSPTPSPTLGPSASPTSSPSSAPTAAPTPGRTPSTETEQAPAALDGNGKSAVDPTQGLSAPTSESSAVGDPHMVNLQGQRFDLMQPGRHVLVQIPRGASGADSLLLVEADARQMGGPCAEMYLQAFNATGRWASEASGGEGLHFSAAEARGRKTTGWMQLGSVDFKVVWGSTDSGVKYLNVFARHLASAGYPVGGLLGEDDHSAAATPHPQCKVSLALVSRSEHGATAGSIADGSAL